MQGDSIQCSCGVLPIRAQHRPDARCKRQRCLVVGVGAHDGRHITQRHHFVERTAGRCTLGRLQPQAEGRAAATGSGVQLQGVHLLFAAAGSLRIDHRAHGTGERGQCLARARQALAVGRCQCPAPAPPVPRTARTPHPARRQAGDVLKAASPRKLPRWVVTFSRISCDASRASSRLPSMRTARLKTPGWMPCSRLSSAARSPLRAACSSCGATSARTIVRRWPCRATGRRRRTGLRRRTPLFL
jgi:hypothetical protein